MKLLYLSAHSILEYDELKIFGELGIDYLSLGSYVIPQKPADKIRPPLPHSIDWLTAPIPPRDKLTKEFVDNFDAVMVMHIPEWIVDNWEIFKHKRVIWRTIGQSTPSIERRLAPYKAEGLEIVRYSPIEERLPDYIGADAMIRFYKDPDEFNLWNGSHAEAITFAQDMKNRGKFCNFEAFKEIVTGFNGRLYGTNNDNAGELSGGVKTYEEMKQKLRDARVYIYTGTQPASYTLSFIEAMMTGIPIVAIGDSIWSSLKDELGIGVSLYEIPSIIRNGVNGFYSDDIGQLREWVNYLLNDYKTAKRIGEMGRKTAIELFGKDNIKSAWKDYLL